MNIFSKDSLSKVFICTSIAVVLGAMIVNKWSSSNTKNEPRAEAQTTKNEQSKKSKTKATEPTIRFKHGGFLSDVDNGVDFSEEEDLVANPSNFRKSRLLNRNPKPFLSDNEDVVRAARRTGRVEREDKDLNKFYFAMLRRLKE